MFHPFLARIVYFVVRPFWGLVSLLVPKDQNLIAINTFPDFDDTTRSIADAVMVTGHRLAILTTSNSGKRPLWLKGDAYVVVYRYSLRGIFLFHRAKYFFYTHGCFYTKWRPSHRQMVINLWHGMPIKRIGLLDGKSQADIQRFHYTIANNELFRKIMSTAFGVSSDRVVLARHPRTDILGRNFSPGSEKLPQHTVLAVWLPTYRASSVGDIRIDGDPDSDIFQNEIDLSRVNAMLKKFNALCVVKPHPMAKSNRALFQRYDSILFMDEEGLAMRNMTLYQLLAMSDFMITDISSVYFDYKTLNRPIIVYCPDIEKYNSTRGFVTDAKMLIDEPIITNIDKLISTIETLMLEISLNDISETCRIQKKSATLELFEKLKIGISH